MSRRDEAQLADLAIRQTLAAARDASNLLAFCDLVERTMPWLPPAERLVLPLDPRAPVSLTLLLVQGQHMPPGLASEWNAWVARYDELAARTPRLALADILTRIDMALRDLEPLFMSARRPATLDDAGMPRPTWAQPGRLTVVFGQDPFPQLERFRRAARGRVVRQDSAGARPDDQFDREGDYPP